MYLNRCLSILKYMKKMYNFLFCKWVFDFVYFYFLIFLVTDVISIYTVNPSKKTEKPGITKELLQCF
jgi:hypothetical protein